MHSATCARPSHSQVEDVKATEQAIQFGEVQFPAHVSPLARSFIQQVPWQAFPWQEAVGWPPPGSMCAWGCQWVAQPGLRSPTPTLPARPPHPPQALTKRPDSRPSAAQLFQHPWVRGHYQQLAAEQQHLAQHRSAPALAAVAAGGLAQTPELRRTVSQPPSPSKSMPEAAGARGGATPAAVASALAPFLPLSQAKMAHKVGAPVRSVGAVPWKRCTAGASSGSTPLLLRCEVGLR